MTQPVRYQMVKEQLRLPAEFLKRTYSFKPALHFLYAETRAEFICRWRDGT